jgi:hypothetical protein
LIYHIEIRNASGFVVDFDIKQSELDITYSLGDWKLIDNN